MYFASMIKKLPIILLNFTGIAASPTAPTLMSLVALC